MTTVAKIRPGQMEPLYDDNDPEGKAKNDADRKDAKLRRSLMSKRGALGLSTFLDQRRRDYGITDGAFTAQCFGDRIWVHQIEEIEGQGFGKDSVLVRPDSMRTRQEKEAPKGIIVNAGLKALDELYSNGIALGHIVYFIQIAPWKIMVDYADGQPFNCLVLRSGDLVASRDTATAMRDPKSKVSIVVKPTLDENGQPDGGQQHMYQDAKGKLWQPQHPMIDEDY